MKKILKTISISLLSGILFFSCSKDEGVISDVKAVQESKITSKTISTNRLSSTSCDIIGSLAVGTGAYTYTYTNNTNNVNINWTANPSTGVVISGQGTSTVTVTFNSSFNGCTLSAYGTSGNDNCQKTITITKSSGCTTAPNFYVKYVKQHSEMLSELTMVSGGINPSLANQYITHTTWELISPLNLGAEIIGYDDQLFGVFQFSSNSIYTFRVTATNNCGTTSKIIKINTTAADSTY